MTAGRSNLNWSSRSKHRVSKAAELWCWNPNSGLTPSQVEGIYNAPPIYKLTQGQGVTTAVFELSGYPGVSDIRAYEKAYGLPKAKIQNINIDGGSCPVAESFGLPCNYAAAEDDIDIELQQAMAPGVSKIQVYLGPNSDQGVLDTYMAIANQNTASAISSSWGQCEASLDAGVAFGEFLAFAQMALQGQSISAATGDSGAYDCLQALAPPAGLARGVDDPASDPLMTAVGGTSFFGTFDPGSPPPPDVSNRTGICLGYGQQLLQYHRLFPWRNDFGLCPFGAGGGGNSTLWAKPSGSMGWERSRQPAHLDVVRAVECVECREVPDISSEWRSQ